jgi:hypothetical protein
MGFILRFGNEAVDRFGAEESFHGSRAEASHHLKFWEEISIPTFKVVFQAKLDSSLHVLKAATDQSHEKRLTLPVQSQP